MDPSQIRSGKFDRLRQQAERLVVRRPDTVDDASPDILELIHELQIHQAELEIQNEELQNAQREFTRLHREYEDLYELAPCGYVTLNSKGIITHINLTGVKLLATDRQSALRQGLTSFIEAGHEDAFLSARRIAGQTGERQRVEFPLKRAELMPLWVRADIEADLDNEAAVSQWRVVLLDISNEKEAHAKLLQSQKMESLGNLAGGIAHDFNNILASIIGYAQIALDEVPRGTRLEDCLQEIYSAGKRAKDLIWQIMTFARQSNEQAEPVDIGKVVKQSLRLLRPIIPANIDIQYKIDSNSMVVGNRALLEQFILNLAHNASDAMEDNGGVLKIFVSEKSVDASFAANHNLSGPGEFVQITISDTGVGIAPELLDTVFEPYFTTKEPGKGTGMGLATAQGTIQKYGGTLMVNSRPGEGAVFTALLPITQKYQKKDAYFFEEVPQGSERILLVDDEPSLAKVGGMLLEGLGYSVTTRTKSLEALELFRDDPDHFDLVVTDMTMPGLTGDKLAVELMKIRPNIPVILYTGYNKRISDETVSKIGIKAFAYKPMAKADLARLVRNVLDEASSL